MVFETVTVFVDAFCVKDPRDTSPDVRVVFALYAVRLFDAQQLNVHKL